MAGSPPLPSTLPTLSVRLRDATREAHRAAERCRFLRRLLRGDMPADEYASYLLALYQVYRALEAGIERHRGHPALAGFPWPALSRHRSLASDLATLLGPEWAARAAPGRGTADAYRVRLDVAGPLTLLAHAYVRYLGDLAGGQLLRDAVARFAPDALAFYTFDLLTEPTRERHLFRARLDALSLCPGDEALIVSEAVAAFELSHSLLIAADRGASRVSAAV